MIPELTSSQVTLVGIFGFGIKRLGPSSKALMAFVTLKPHTAPTDRPYRSRNYARSRQVLDTDNETGDNQGVERDDQNPYQAFHSSPVSTSLADSPSLVAAQNGVSSCEAIDQLLAMLEPLEAEAE